MTLISAYAVPHPPLAVPAVGRGAEKGIPETMAAYYRVGTEIAQAQPDTIILVSPHAPALSGAFRLIGGSVESMSLASFGAGQPVLTMNYDQDLISLIRDKAQSAAIPTHISAGNADLGSRVDHGSFVPLYFIARAEWAASVAEQQFPSAAAGKSAVRSAADARQRSSADFRAWQLTPGLVRLSFSGLSPQIHHNYGRAIRDAIAASGKRVVFIASGDLSHRLRADSPYGLAPRGEAFDRDLTAALGAGDFARLLAYDDDLLAEVAECGLRSFNILGGVLADTAYKSELLSYEGTYGVGYAIAAFRDLRPDSPSLSSGKDIPWLSGDPYVALAKHTVENYIRTGRKPPLTPAEQAALPQEITAGKAGAFVTIHKQGQLRGCIGTIQPSYGTLAEEIMSNAVAAGTRDPRFRPIGLDELSELEYSVDVLRPPEPITDSSELDIKRYGVIVSRGLRKGLLLPNLDGISSIEQQIDIARQKAGIGRSEPVELERFEVVRHQNEQG
ncbi:MAG: AmmeMemoRadiSam system protein A [Clostridiales bacterium]|nr:AmmeMemoRadiSam system protein A [Clostridiales bacterium]